MGLSGRKGGDIPIDWKYAAQYILEHNLLTPEEREYFEGVAQTGDTSEKPKENPPD